MISLYNFIDECDVRIGHINKTDLVMHGVDPFTFPPFYLHLLYNVTFNHKVEAFIKLSRLSSCCSVYQ